MDGEWPFQLLVFLSFAGTFAIRMYYHCTTGSFCGKLHTDKEGRGVLWLKLLSLPVLLGMIVYMIHPPLLAWAALDLSAGVRLFGAALSAFTLGWVLWAHHSLSKDFSPTLRIRPGHTLVTHGPYRWVRHPLYAAAYPGFVGLFLLSANWFLGLYGLAVLTLLLLVRIPREEAMLAEAFGQAYRDYMDRTGRLVPRLFSAAR